jgi:AcrR family transcriptional regulator
MPPSVKGSTPGGHPRRYDASTRRARSVARRDAVVEVARRHFLARGFTATTIVDVAADAQVSVESVYKWFGSKVGLLKAVWDQSLAGSEPTHAELRSDAGSRAATDGPSVIRSWARLSAEVGARGDPVHRLLESASHVDPTAAELYAEIERERGERMTHNAAYLVERHYLRDDVTAAQARDVLLLYSSLYERLVTDAGWTSEQFIAFVERGLSAHLLP